MMGGGEVPDVESLVDAWVSGELDSPDMVLSAYKAVVLAISSGEPLDMDEGLESLLDAGHALYLEVLARNNEREPRMHRLMSRVMGRGVTTRSMSREGSVQTQREPRRVSLLRFNPLSAQPVPSMPNTPPLHSPMSEEEEEEEAANLPQASPEPASRLSLASQASEPPPPPLAPPPTLVRSPEPQPSVSRSPNSESPGRKRAASEMDDDDDDDDDEGEASAPTIEVIGSAHRELKRFKTDFREETILLKGLSKENARDDTIVSLFDTILDRLRNLCGAEPQDRCILEIQSSEALSREIWFHLRRSDQIDGRVMADKFAQVIQSNENFLISGPLKVFYIHVPEERPAGRNPVLPSETLDHWYERMVKGNNIFKIDNPDNELCLALSLVVAVNYINMEKWTFCRMKKKGCSDPGLVAQARIMCHDAGVDPDTPCGLADIHKFQDFMKEYRIVVYGGKNSTTDLLFKGPSSTSESIRKNVYVLWRDEHFSPILKPNAVFSHSYFCPPCLKGYEHVEEHICAGTCWRCTAPVAHPDPPFGQLMRCPDCNRHFANQQCFDHHKNARVYEKKQTTCDVKKFCRKCERLYRLGGRGKKALKEHKCNHFMCENCKQYCPEGHICYMQKFEEKTLNKNTLYRRIYWDTECSQYHNVDGKPDTWHEHRVVLLVSQQVCSACEHIESPTHQCEKCWERQKIFHSFDDPDRDPIVEFVSYLRTLSNEDTHITLFAHNARSYDHFPLIKQLVKESLTPKLICQGQKIISIKYANLHFKDSLMFIPLPLSKMGSSFGYEELKKGYFPFLAITPENYSYVGPMPAREMFCVSSMNVKNAKAFNTWYDAKVKEDHLFDFKKEIMEYRVSDVTILRQSLEKFRSEFIALAGFDCLYNCISLSSSCMYAYRRNIMPEEQISIEPPGGYTGDRHSFEAMKWLTWEQHLLGNRAKILHAENGREVRVLNRPVDGYYELPDGSKHVLQYHGCFFHGCPDCYPPPRDVVPGKAEKYRGTRLEATRNFTTMLKNAGFIVKEIWGCEFKRKMKENPELAAFFTDHPLRRKEPLSLREALYGGRTSTIRPYYKADLAKGETIEYVDVVSLYPSVLLNCEYVTGHPRVYNGTDPQLPSVANMNGVVKARVLPPSDLFFPLLPYRAKKKLLFPLCRTCAESESRERCSHSDDERALTGVWVTAEFKIAVLELGYQVLDIFELYQYPGTSKFNRARNTDSIFSGYVRTFMAKKIEASGYPPQCDTPLKQAEYRRQVWDKDGIRLDPAKMVKNEALRFLAKLMNNSFWGKLGEVTQRTSPSLVNSFEEYNTLISNPNREVQSITAVSEDMLMVGTKPTVESDRSLPTSSIVHAAQVTAHARIKLFRLLHQVQDRCLYHDTDSVVYINRPGEPQLPTGSFLGELTDELEGYGEGSFIYEWVSAGPKQYCAKVAVKGDIRNTVFITRLRGITINESCADVVTFDNMKAMVVDNAAAITIQIPHKIDKLPGWRLVTRPASKIWRPVLKKRRVIEGHRTVPLGFDPAPPPLHPTDEMDDADDEGLLAAMDNAPIPLDEEDLKLLEVMTELARS